MPDLPVRDGDIHLPEKVFGMMTGIEDAVILPDEFVFGILTDGAELFVDVSDGALDVGNGDNRVLIERKFLVREFLERSLAGGKAFLHRFLSPLAFRNVGAYGYVLLRFAVCRQSWDDGGI